MTVSIPTLETDRLILRAPALADFEALCAFYASERATFVGGQMDAEKVWRHLALEIGHWQMLGYGRWTVEEKSSGKTAGIIGLWNPHGWPEPEIGWDLFEGFGSKGYATEAAIAARSYAYETLGWTTAISLVDPNNHASAAVAKRMGAVLDGTFTHDRFGEVQIWRHLSPDDLASGGMEAYA
ncbi:acetyltransferase [Leisingera sp. ANG-M1]|uniref:GNAT family N-acetyltransferase n=1 Tax=Leisingera sp. ANG-M1 TaxID=1577895 RepID=UPI0005801072|nr:GNAT family N-acetyltransferase [Leisingera sp. ANG-M1]KIC12418.1 acetyltransferase [Leisingera sp. ANG-M1]